MGRLDDMASRVARSVSAVDEGFTVIVEKPIRFRPEGSTANSLANAKMILDAGYEFVRATMIYDNISGDWKVDAFFRRGNQGAVSAHLFSGFSYGYGGEGPRGLMEFGRMFGVRLDPRKVMSSEYKDSMPPRGAVDIEMAFT